MTSIREMVRQLPPEWRAQLQDERRQARQAAEVFVRICQEGRAEDLERAAALLHGAPSDAWLLAMRKVAKLPQVSAEIQEAFVSIWVETKMLPLTVGDRPIMAAALRRLMPRDYSGPSLILYRGAANYERRRRFYGFSWTTEIDTARSFAAYWSRTIPGSDVSPIHGVVLRTIASPNAILLIRQPEDYYDEGEVVVDPFQIGKVALVEQLNPEEDAS